MSGDAYRGTEEAARARLAELQLEREKRLARFDELGMPVPVEKDPRLKIPERTPTPPDQVRVIASVLVMLVIAAAALMGHQLEAALFVAVLISFNAGYAPYFFRAAQNLFAQIPKVPHVSEFNDPEPLILHETKPVQRVLTADEEKAKDLEIERERLAYEEIELEIEATEALLRSREP